MLQFGTPSALEVPVEIVMLVIIFVVACAIILLAYLQGLEKGRLLGRREQQAIEDLRRETSEF